MDLLVAKARSGFKVSEIGIMTYCDDVKFQHMQGQDFMDVHLPKNFFILVLSLGELNDGSATAVAKDFKNTKAGDCFVNNIVCGFQAGDGFGKGTGLLGLPNAWWDLAEVASYRSV